MLDDGTQSNGRGLDEGIAADAGAKRGESDAGDSVLLGEAQAARVSTGQQPGILRPAGIDRADGVKDVLRAQLARRRRYGAARGTATDAAALLHDARAACAVNRAVHATTSAQPAIGRVDDGIRLHLDNIAAHQRQRYTINGACRHKLFWHKPTLQPLSPRLHTSRPNGSSSRRLTSCRKRAA